MVTAPGAPTRRRWPLLAIGASAGTATWSGWVGLGQLTGFGVVHPLPGIADAFTINTAVTLPIGVEAYAMYALSIATSNRALPVTVRRYAWASSAAALVLGMAGQVAYHVMTASHPLTSGPAVQLAPWQVIALVSCLPVLVLGAASLLWHLAGATGTSDPAQDPARAGEPTSASSAQPAASRAAELRPARPDDVARLRDAITARHTADGPAPPPADPVTGPTAPGSAVAVPVPVTDPGTGPVPVPVADPDAPSLARSSNSVLPFHVVGRPAPSDPGTAHRSSSRRPSHSDRLARPADLAALREAIGGGVWPHLPSVRAIRDHLSIGSDHAAAARRAIAAEITRESADHELTTRTPQQHSPETETHPEQEPQHPAEETNPAVTKKASH